MQAKSPKPVSNSYAEVRHLSLLTREPGHVAESIGTRFDRRRPDGGDAGLGRRQVALTIVFLFSIKRAL